MKILLLTALALTAAFGQKAEPPQRSARLKIKEAQYNRGTRHIDRRDYAAAIQSFDAVIESKDPRADGALYWKAYAQHKLGRRDQALETLAQLQKDHPQSRWLNDAKALEVEVRQASGKPVSPEDESDDDLKLLALHSLMMSDPDRSLPVVEKLLADPKTSPRVKERALFVLAQSRNEKARAAVAAVAKGSSNPDLQVKAVEYLGIAKGNSAVLEQIYASTSDVNVRRSVLRGYMMSRDSERLLALAKVEQNPDLRREAIYMLGSVRDEKTSSELVSMYGSGLDESTRIAIIDALMMQNNAKSLIEIARSENDPKLKQQAVQRLALMKSKEAREYMMEVLNK